MIAKWYLMLKLKDSAELKLTRSTPIRHHQKCTALDFSL